MIREILKIITSIRGHHLHILAKHIFESRSQEFFRDVKAFKISTMSAKTSRQSPFCNFNCICTKSDCGFQHNISSLDQRRFYSSVYNKIGNIKKYTNEDNFDTRRSNCTFGQLCEREDCGYRHFLNYEGRKKFITSLKNVKTSSSAPQAAQVTQVAQVPQAAQLSQVTQVSQVPLTQSYSSRLMAPEKSEIVTLKETVTILKAKVESLEDHVKHLNAIIDQLKGVPLPTISLAIDTRNWGDISDDETGL